MALSVRATRIGVGCCYCCCSSCCLMLLRLRLRLLDAVLSDRAAQLVWCPLLSVRLWPVVSRFCRLGENGVRESRVENRRSSPEHKKGAGAIKEKARLGGY